MSRRSAHDDPDLGRLVAQVAWYLIRLPAVPVMVGWFVGGALLGPVARRFGWRWT